jgi:hypothetical protein
MIKSYFLLCLLFLGCGKNIPVQTLPVNSATPEETQKIDEALALIQADLAEEGIHKNLRRVKIIVADLDDPSIQGRCYRNAGKGVALVMSHQILAQESPDEDLYPWYFTVLLHEIGHCYFNRDHETEVIPFPNKEVVYSAASSRPGKEHTGAWISPSVMNLASDRYMLKALRRYYVKEVAGLDRVRSIEDLNNYTEASLREIPSRTIISREL